MLHIKCIKKFHNIKNNNTVLNEKQQYKMFNDKKIIYHLKNKTTSQNI